MTKRNIARALATGVFAATAAAALSTTASAAEEPVVAIASFSETTVNGQTIGVLRYTGTAGADKVAVDVSGGIIEISHLGTNPAALSAGPGCAATPYHDLVTCGSVDRIDDFRALLGGGDDSITTNVALHGVINAGADDDTWIRNDAAGFGARSSSITFFGDTGEDEANYKALDDTPVTVTLDNIANDGAPGDSDNVTTSVEEVFTAFD